MPQKASSSCQATPSGEFDEKRDKDRKYHLISCGGNDERGSRKLVKNTTFNVSSRCICLRQSSIRSSTGICSLKYVLVLFTLVNLLSISSCQPSTLSVARYSLAAAGAGNKIVFAGGRYFSNPSVNYVAIVDVYDVLTGTWNSTSTGVGQLSVARDGLAAASAGNKVVFAGGSGAGFFSATVDIFDVASGAWNSTTTGAGQLSIARQYLAAASTGSIIIFAGGRGSTSVAVVDIYDSFSGSWTSTSTGAGQLSVPRSDLAGAGAGNKIVFAGGRFNDTTAVATVDVYDIVTGLWNSTSTGAGELSTARQYLSAASAGNKVVFAGGSFRGCSSCATTYLTTVDIYDVITGSWVSSSDGAGELSVTRAWGAAAAADNKIIFGGGFVGGSAYLDQIDVYDVSTGSWSSTLTGEGALNQGRAYLAAASSGHIVVFAGGWNGTQLPTVDVYDASSGLHLASTTTAASTTAITSTTSEATVSAFVATTFGTTTTIAATSLSSTTTIAETTVGSTTTIAAITASTTTAAFTTTLAATISTSEGGGSKKLNTKAIAGISVAAAVVAVGILIGVGIILGWNRQLIAAVHELRMMHIINERKSSMDIEL